MIFDPKIEKKNGFFFCQKSKEIDIFRKTNRIKIFSVPLLWNHLDTTFSATPKATMIYGTYAEVLEPASLRLPLENDVEEVKRYRATVWLLVNEKQVTAFG